MWEDERWTDFVLKSHSHDWAYVSFAFSSKLMTSSEKQLVSDAYQRSVNMISNCWG